MAYPIRAANSQIIDVAYLREFLIAVGDVDERQNPRSFAHDQSLFAQHRRRRGAGRSSTGLKAGTWDLVGVLAYQAVRRHAQYVL